MIRDPNPAKPDDVSPSQKFASISAHAWVRSRRMIPSPINDMVGAVNLTLVTSCVFLFISNVYMIIVCSIITTSRRSNFLHDGKNLLPNPPFLFISGLVQRAMTTIGQGINLQPFFPGYFKENLSTSFPTVDRRHASSGTFQL